jgi:hypothetical protein
MVMHIQSFFLKRIERRIGIYNDISIFVTLHCTDTRVLFFKALQNGISRFYFLQQ